MNMLSNSRVSWWEQGPTVGPEGFWKALRAFVVCCGGSGPTIPWMLPDAISATGTESVVAVQRPAVCSTGCAFRVC